MVIYVEELYDKINDLKQQLDNLELFKQLNACIKRVKENKDLVEKVEEYNISKDEKLRLDIYNYDEIKEFKRVENEVNLLILHINQKLKIINNERWCHNESNKWQI